MPDEIVSTLRKQSVDATYYKKCEIHLRIIYAPRRFRSFTGKSFAHTCLCLLTFYTRDAVTSVNLNISMIRY